MKSSGVTTHIIKAFQHRPIFSPENTYFCHRISEYFHRWTLACGLLCRNSSQPWKTLKKHNPKESGGMAGHGPLVQTQKNFDGIKQQFLVKNNLFFLSPHKQRISYHKTPTFPLHCQVRRLSRETEWSKFEYLCFLDIQKMTRQRLASLHGTNQAS